MRAERFVRLDGGSTEVYKIDVSGAAASALVLKIYADEPTWMPAKEALVAGWFAPLAPLVPRWLAVDESRTILPLRFALLTSLPGRPLRESFGDPDIADGYRQMGALLRRVHAIPMDAYGYVKGEGVENPQNTNADYMREAFDDVFRRFRELGAEPGLARRLEGMVAARSIVLAESTGPVLAHDDFQQGNVLALRDADGRLRLSGLVDFGNARAADPLFDLAKALFCSAHEDPASYRPLLEGYGPLAHSRPEVALWLYTLYHRLTMWCWLSAPGEGGPADLLRDIEAMARDGGG